MFIVRVLEAGARHWALCPLLLAFLTTADARMLPSCVTVPAAGVFNYTACDLSQMMDVGDTDVVKGRVVMTARAYASLSLSEKVAAVRDTVADTTRGVAVSLFNASATASHSVVNVTVAVKGGTIRAYFTARKTISRILRFFRSRGHDLVCDKCIAPDVAASEDQEARGGEDFCVSAIRPEPTKPPSDRGDGLKQDL